MFKGIIMKLSVYKPKLLNKAASTVYENHIANEQIRSDVQTETKGVLSSKEVADIICLYIYGATNKDISKLFGVKAASGVYLRDCYRDVQIPFQTMKKKRLGKMVFTYDRSLVEKYYNNLADDLKLITKCFIFEDRLQAVTKIRASEVIL